MTQLYTQAPPVDDEPAWKKAPPVDDGPVYKRAPAISDEPQVLGQPGAPVSQHPFPNVLPGALETDGFGRGIPTANILSTQLMGLDRTVTSPGFIIEQERQRQGAEQERIGLEQLAFRADPVSQISLPEIPQLRAATEAQIADRSFEARRGFFSDIYREFKRGFSGSTIGALAGLGQHPDDFNRVDGIVDRIDLFVNAEAPRDLPKGGGIGGFIGSAAGEVLGSYSFPQVMALSVWRAGARKEQEIIERTGNAPAALAGGTLESGKMLLFFKLLGKKGSDVGTTVGQVAFRKSFDKAAQKVELELNQALLAGQRQTIKNVLGKLFQDTSIAMGGGLAITESGLIAQEYSEALFGTKTFGEATAAIGEQAGPEAIDAVFSGLFIGGFGAVHGLGRARTQFKRQLASARTPQERAQIHGAARTFVEQHVEAQRFVANASRENLAVLRQRFAGRNDPQSVAMVELIDAKLKGPSARASRTSAPPAPKVDLLTPEGTAKFVQSQPEVAQRLATARVAPSRGDVRGIVGAERFTSEQRTQFQELIRDRLPKIAQQAHVRALDRGTGEIVDVQVLPEDATKTLREEERTAVQLNRIIQSLGAKTSLAASLRKSKLSSAVKSYLRQQARDSSPIQAVNDYLDLTKTNLQALRAARKAAKPPAQPPQPKPAIVEQPPGATREQIPEQRKPEAQAEGRRQQVTQAQPVRETDRPRHQAFKQRRRQTKKSLEDVVQSAARDIPSALEEANDRLRLFANNPDNPSLEADSLAIEPDFVDNDPLTIARLRRTGDITIKEAAGEQHREILGDALYERAVQEAMSGRAARLTTVREQALAAPEHHDPELVLSSILLEARSTADVDNLNLQRDFFDPHELDAGDTFTIFGTPVRVEDVEAGRVLTFPEAAIQVPIQFLKNDVPADMGSFKAASGEVTLLSKEVLAEHDTGPITGAQRSLGLGTEPSELQKEVDVDDAAKRRALEKDESGALFSRTEDLIDPGRPFGAIGAAEQPGSEISPRTGQIRQPLRSAEDLVGEDTAKQSERDKPFDLIENEDTRARIKAAREGVTKTGLGAKLDEWWQSLIRGTQRGTLQFLPRTEQFGQARSDLLKLTKARSIAQDRTFQLLKRTLKPLDSAEYELFTLKVLLDDLAHETGALPFGYTAESVAADKSRVDAEVEKSAKVQASIEFRNKMWDAVRGDYVEAMEAVGYRAGDKLKREDYFRHQVLHYMNVKSATKGAGKGVQTPTGRGFLKRRKGSQLDINANYLQAEWEVISQMLVDTQTAETIKSIRETYDILDSLKKKAKDKNFELLVGGPEAVQEIRELRAERTGLRAQRPQDKEVKQRLKLISELLNKLDPTEPMRRKIAIGMSTLEKVRPKDEFEPDDLDMAKIAELAKSGEGDAQLGARTVLAGITERQQLIHEELGDSFVEWEDIVPSTHIAYAIRPGRTIYLAHSIQESLAQRLLEGTVDELGITADDLRAVRGIGSEFRPLVVPNEVAQQLDALAPEPTESVLALAQRKLLRTWKVFRLLGPTSIIKYNLRNASEIEKVFTLNPKALRKVPQAVRDLYALFTNAEDVPTEVREWAERGGLKSLTRVQEIGEVDKLKEFDRFLRRKESSLATKVATLPMSAWRGYWRIAGLGTDYRESILRYASYLDYLESMRQSKDNEPRNFGASMPAEIRGIKDIRDRAYKLGNDLLGAYDDVSIVGQELRKRWYPFWSFQETNFRAYVQGLRNIAANERMAGKAGAAIARAAGIQVASKSLWLSVKLGRTAILLYGAHALLQAFNWAFFDDEERELPKSVRGRPHIILGRNKDGEVRYFSRLGTSGDFLEWFGLDQLSTDIGDYLSDRRTMQELVTDVALAPANKILGGSSPFVKGPFELATKRSLFPDIARPMRIRDRWEYVFRTYGLEQEYRAVTGKPTKGYLQHRITTLPAYTIEPGRSAYSEIQNLKRRYLKSVGKPQGFSEGGRSDALRNFRLSIRYQDEEGAKKYLIEYISMGGTKQGIKTSLKRMHPLGGLTERERKLFVASLSAQDRELVAKAEAYYSEVLLGTRDSK